MLGIGSISEVSQGTRLDRDIETERCCKSCRGKEENAGEGRARESLRINNWPQYLTSPSIVEEDLVGG